jgi:hypothetical protein
MVGILGLYHAKLACPTNGRNGWLSAPDTSQIVLLPPPETGFFAYTYTGI